MSGAESGGAQRSERDARFGDALDAALSAAGGRLAPATLLAAFDCDGVVAWRALGEPRLDGVATSRNTVFRIASMSKSFLAAAALALADDGRLELDTPIDGYVPGVRFVLGEAEHRVTVRELLANRSGMPEDNAWGDRQLGASRETISELARAGLRLTALPGERYQYSNLGMSLVGRAIEAVTEVKVEEFVRGRLIEPLGLSHTRYEAEAYPSSTDLATGFRTFDDGQSWIPEPYVGSGALACIGALFSTVDDVATWAAFLASAFDEVPLRTDVLSASARREMQRARTPIPIEGDDLSRRVDAMGYSLGLFVEHDRRFGWVSQHSGGLPGFSSHMRWHQSSGIGVVAFANSDAFRTEPLATGALERILEVTKVSDEIAPWPETLDAGERIDALLRAGTPLSEAGEMVSPNLLRDIPDAVRLESFSEIRGVAGAALPQPPFAERIVVSHDPAHLKWRIEGDHDAVICEIRLVGLKRPLLQSLTCSLASGAGRGDSLPTRSGHVGITQAPDIEQTNDGGQQR